MRPGARLMLVSTVTLAAGGCWYEYPTPPDTNSAGVTDFVFSEDADPAVAKLDYVKTQLLVQPYPGAEGDEVTAAIGAAGATIVGGMADTDTTVLSVPQDHLSQVAAALADTGLFETVAKDYLYDANLTPNDPVFARQTYFSRMNLTAAWDLATGSEQVLIAIVDTGVDATHPELASKILGGWSSDGSSTFADVHGHGTAVAGVAAAAGNNAVGIAGVAWNSPVLAVRVGNAQGQSSSSDIAAGILWAAGNGAKVINVSFAPLWADRVVRSAAQSAFNRGSLVIISAGNAGGLSQAEGYPETVFVGAVSDDVLASFSDRGPFVDLVAPGVSIRVTERNGAYGVLSGTSFAAPIVSGVTALMWSVNPDFRPAILRQFLLDTAVDLGPPGRDTSYGEGRIDAQGAVAAAIANRDAVDAIPPTLTLLRPSSPGEQVQGRYLIIADAKDASGVSEVVLSIDGLAYATDTRSPYLFIVDTNTFDARTHEISVIAVDSVGNQSAPITVSVPFLHYTEQGSRATTIQFRSPANGAVVAGDVLIQASVSDPDGLSVVEWLVDSETMLVSKLSGSSSGISYMWRAVEATPGPHQVTIRVTDLSGQTASASILLTRG